MIKNHCRDAPWRVSTISDDQWLNYYGKVWNKVVVAVSPNYTSQDCSNCEKAVK
ncbi:MAG: transposase [Aphanothece sp. CMT-3BRIN-NPC111]|nr:transposase [Aphanothece sp. CMT-3BRIN-NPC111]